MEQHTTGRRCRCVGIAAACTVAAVAVADPTPPLVYSSLEGISVVYDGDLSAGTLTASEVLDHAFRVDRDGMAQHQEVGDFDGDASFSMTLDLVSYLDGVATFTGNGPGPHLVAVDEFGEWIQADVVTLELAQMEPPGFTFEGTGVLENVSFSAADLQNVCTKKLDGGGALAILRTGADVSLEDYLMTGGMGGMPLRIHELEVQFTGDACWGDIDRDGDTDQSDLGILLASYNIDDGGDLNCDGMTNQADLGILLASYQCGL